MTHHVILGAGPAGVIAAETIRKHAPHDPITLVGDENEAPYSRMAIPYLLIGKVGEEGTHLRHTADHYNRLNIQLLRGVRAKRLDTVKRTVELSDGIIMEALQKRGVELSVVEMGDRMVPRMMGPTAGGMIKDWCGNHGVKVFTGTRVEAIERGNGAEPGLLGKIAQVVGIGSASAPNGKMQVRLSSGGRGGAGLVISATGVRPNIGFLETSGVRCLVGVMTDE